MQVLGRILKLPVQNSNSKISACPDLYIQLLQILIPTTNDSLLCQKGHFTLWPCPRRSFICKNKILLLSQKVPVLKTGWIASGSVPVSIWYKPHQTCMDTCNSQVWKNTDLHLVIQINSLSLSLSLSNFLSLTHSVVFSYLVQLFLLRRMMTGTIQIGCNLNTCS